MKDFNRGGGFAKRQGGTDDRRSGGFGERRGGGNFERREGGRPNFKQGNGNFGRPAMFGATCAECGQRCEVPFKPTGDKPVFCSNCFKGKDHAGQSRPSDRDFAKPRYQENNFAPSRPAAVAPTKEQFEALSAKLDKILRILEAVPARPPVFVPAERKTERKVTSAKAPKKVKSKKAKKK